MYNILREGTGHTQICLNYICLPYTFHSVTLLLLDLTIIISSNLLCSSLGLKGKGVCEGLRGEKNYNHQLFDYY